MTALPPEPANFHVDRKACVRCGLCVDDCVAAVLEMSPDGPAPVRPDDCIRCQHCLAICPKAAISIFGKNPADSVRPENLPDAGALRRLMQNRRSVREFLPDEIPPDELRELVDTAAYAPSGVNAQGVHFAVVATRQAMDALRRRVGARLEKQLARPGRETSDKDEMLRQCVDDWRDGGDFVFRNAPHLVVASASLRAACGEVDAVIALGYLELYARARGFGALWCGFAMHALNGCAERRIFREIGVPRGYRPIYAMLLGRPARTYPRAVQRGPAQATLHGL